jgi:hypothetical protein
VAVFGKRIPGQVCVKKQSFADLAQTATRISVVYDLRVGPVGVVNRRPEVDPFRH